MDIAMVGGFGLALAAGIVFLFIDRLNKSEMDDSRKRLITYATFAAFAEAWLEAERKGLGVDRGEHPEAAWLTDRARGTAGSDWKQKRSAIAARALATLDTIARPDRDASRRADEDGAADQSP